MFGLTRPMLLFALTLGAISGANPAAAGDKEKLKPAMEYWRASGPVCADPEGDFISKEFDQGPPFKPCNDGDSVLFSGLLCSVGEELGCETVKRSQDETGKWWRSPRNRREKPDEGGSETNFSNDHAAGVWLYILQKRDVAAFKAWSQWISDNSYAGFIPKYCTDQRCVFKLSDCPVMDRVAVSLNLGNPVCESVLFPGTIPPTYTAETIQTLRSAYQSAVDLVEQVPGGKELLQLDIVTPQLDRLLGELQKQLEKLEDARIKLNTLIRASTDSAGIVARLNAVVNDPGYSRHSVAVTSYFLLKYGGIPSVTGLDAARSVAAQDPKNAFFEYVAHGSTPRMASNIIQGCRASGDISKHPRFQWIWERSDDDKSNPKEQLLYWDCLFTAKLYFEGSLPGSALPEMPGWNSVYLGERKAFEAARKAVEELIDMVKNFGDHPDKSLAYIAKFPGAAARKIQEGAVDGTLKGLGVSEQDRKNIVKALTPPELPTPEILKKPEDVPKVLKKLIPKTGTPIDDLF